MTSHFMSSPTLLVLAAGMGSRYGGLKQLDPVGPAGETLLDYSVHDAIRAGFDRVVFLIRREIEKDFRDKIGARYAGKLSVAYAFQQLDDLPVGFIPPAGRTKPWGTAHAVWCAREAVTAPLPRSMRMTSMARILSGRSGNSSPPLILPSNRPASPWPVTVWTKP